AQLRSHGRRGAAAEGAHVERRAIRVAHHELDGIDRRPELLGHLLGERGADVLADLDLTGEHRDAALLADVEPGGHLLRQLPASGPAAGLLARRRRRPEADEHAASQDLEEGAPVALEPVKPALDLVLCELGTGIERLSHRTEPFFVAEAARRTASRMRG